MNRCPTCEGEQEHPRTLHLPRGSFGEAFRMVECPDPYHAKQNFPLCAACGLPITSGQARILFDDAFQGQGTVAQDVYHPGGGSWLRRNPCWPLFATLLGAAFVFYLLVMALAMPRPVGP